MKKKQEKLTEKVAWGEEPEANSCNLTVAFNWYNAIIDKKECKKYLIEYVKKNKEFGESFTKTEKETIVKKIKVADEFDIKMTGTIARMIDNGWDKDSIVNKKSNASCVTMDDYLVRGISELPDVNNYIEEDVKPKNIISIQDRMQDKFIDYLSFIEGQLDDFVENGYVDNFDSLTYCMENNIPALTIKKMESFYMELFKEIELLVYGRRDKKDKDDPMFDQLQENYDFMTTPQQKKYYKCLESLVNGLQQAYTLKKSNKKVKVKTQKTIDKVVSKLRYLTEDFEYKLKSINPTKIVGMQEVWIWDSKNSKLGVYFSDDPAGFEVNKTTLKNISNERSICKKIRKPKELWNTCKSKGKRSLTKYFEGCKTKEYPLTGRFNEDILIVNAF
jgi:hypothetical protein